MPELDAEQQDALVRELIQPDDSCAHNFAPVFALVAGWLADAWDAGHEEGCVNPHGCPHLDDNPYRGGDDG